MRPVLPALENLDQDQDETTGGQPAGEKQADGTYTSVGTFETMQVEMHLPGGIEPEPLTPLPEPRRDEVARRTIEDMHTSDAIRPDRLA